MSFSFLEREHTVLWSAVVWVSAKLPVLLPRRQFMERSEH
jgi:hypothetical protein